jgi:gliding motility-associated-like protein
MINSLTKLKLVWLLLILLINSTAVFSQLPQCDRIYLDQYDFTTLTSTQKIYNYNPSAPVSATNPSLNTIQLPNNQSGGLTVSEVLGSSNPTLTFYTVINDQYWYYNPSTSTWVNTNHFTGSSGAAVNIASGGGYIYNLAGNAGEIYRYDGTGNGTLLVTVSDFMGEGPFDLIADCAGNFYLLNATGNFAVPFLRKYNSSGVLVQSWTVNNVNNYTPSGGFGIFGTQIFMDDLDQLTFNLNGIVSGAINTTSADLLSLAGPFAAYNGYLAGDLGSCASGVPVLPEITITASATTVAVGITVTFTSAINAGGTNPQYQWYVNGVPVTGQTSPTFTYEPNSGDVVTCLLTSNLACIAAPTGLSNAITITVDGCNTPTLAYTPSSLCKGTGAAIPSFSPAGGVFSAAPAGLNINSATGGINLNSSNAGTYIITYTKPANALCPASSVRDTVTIYAPPVVDITLDDVGNQLCQNELVTLHATANVGYIYDWYPAMFFPNTTDEPTVTAKAVQKGYIDVSVTNAQGCTTIDSIELKPEPCCSVMIPSAFTPNGDGLNDVFKINSVADQTINHFSVYNKFGERVFNTTLQSKGWDGTFRSKPCDVGVYFYYVSYTCANGLEIVKKGDVSLIR